MLFQGSQGCYRIRRKEAQSDYSTIDCYLLLRVNCRFLLYFSLTAPCTNGNRYWNIETTKLISFQCSRLNHITGFTQNFNCTSTTLKLSKTTAIHTNGTKNPAGKGNMVVKRGVSSMWLTVFCFWEFLETFRHLHWSLEQSPWKGLLWGCFAAICS